jgi:hypothetical protein
MAEGSQETDFPAGEEEPLDYDAFLSYTHSDRPVASAIQKGLHRIGRRLGQLRALRIFRDDTDLVAIRIFGVGSPMRWLGRAS